LKNNLNYIKISNMSDNSKADSTKINIVLLGDAGVGKTTFLTRFKTAEFTKEYKATNGVQKTEINVNTNKGPVTLVVQDVSGSEKYNRGAVDWKDVRATIIMFDVTNRQSYKSVEWWMNFHKCFVPEQEGVVRNYNPKDKKICILLGNKVDCKERKVKKSTIETYIKDNCLYYDYSAKSNYNFEWPFSSIIESVLGKDTMIADEEDDRGAEEEGICEECAYPLIDCEHLHKVCPSCTDREDTLEDYCIYCVFEGSSDFDNYSKILDDHLQLAVKAVELGKKSKTLPELKNKKDLSVEYLYKLFKTGFESKN
jgi:small GTP-binding protein